MTGVLTTEEMRILLVEDERGDAELVKAVLKTARYGRFVITVADRLASAVAAVREHRFEAALLDLSLPDSRGMATIRSFRAAAPDLPVIVLTGLDDRELGLRALREGCQDYLVKGHADGDTTARTIVHSIQRKQLEVELVHAKARLQAAYDEMEQRVVERTSQLRRVAVEATMAEERERQAIARDLHDDLGQILHVVRIKLGQLTKPLPTASRDALIGDLTDLVGDASRTVRSLTSQLSPPTLVELGLLPALSWLADEMERLVGLKVDVTGDRDTLPPLTPAHAAILFRAVRELLINVSKHTASDVAQVTVAAERGRLVLSVTDPGSGITSPGSGIIDWPTTLGAGKGFGLASVHERITFLGGTMDICTTPGDGTRVTLELPLAPGPEGSR